MYRVYDKKEKCWIKNNVYLSPNDDISISKNTILGTKKLSLLSDQRYTFQNDIGLYDKNNTLIFEGDICKFNSNDATGIIAYVSDHASYYLLDYKNSMYYPLSIDYCKDLEVIGNNFENIDLLDLME